MQAFLEIAVALCWALWLGSMAFFSFVVAPTIFRTLGRDAASPVIQALFPPYYMFAMIAGGTAVALCLAFRADLRITLPLAAGLIIVTYARQRILPAVEKARSRSDEETFGRLHRLSVQLNMTVMALLILAGTVIAL
ncbi:MAG: hypothetical protein ACI8TX_000020 [Hyphomicrobiaceae bacterium]